MYFCLVILHFMNVIFMFCRNFIKVFDVGYYLKLICYFCLCHQILQFTADVLVLDRKFKVAYSVFVY